MRKTIPDSWIRLTLTEGKNRQVRRMTAAVGHPTLRLVRWSIGTVTADGLAPGEWEPLTLPSADNSELASTWRQAPVDRAQAGALQGSVRSTERPTAKKSPVG